MSSTSRTRALLAGLVFTAGATFAPHGNADTSLADGNGKGINTRLFRAAVDSKGFFSVNGTDVLGKGDLTGNVTFRAFARTSTDTVSKLTAPSSAVAYP